MNRSEKYNIKSNCDQFGNHTPEPTFFEDQYETVAINEVERIALGYKERPGAAMIELGSNQAYYSMLWGRIVPNAINIMVEPNAVNMMRGRSHFLLNNLSGVFYDKIIGIPFRLQDGDGRGIEPTGMITLSEILRENNLQHFDLLHSDIDSAEDAMLKTNSEVFQQGLVKNIVLMTHGNDRHAFSKDFLLKCGYTLTFDDPAPSIGWDGMIVAYKTTTSA